MIDLHCHLLPAIDDGPLDIEASLQMAQAAVHEGIHTMVVTPHVDLKYGIQRQQIAEGVAVLCAALEREQIPLTVHSGAEIALTRLPGLDDSQLRSLGLAFSSYLLIESPYSPAGILLEQAVFDLHVRGFRPLLAHPERCPEFHGDVERLRRLVEGGVACSMSAGSVVGQFGRTVKRFASHLVHEQLVHNLSSDAHDAVKRAPSLHAAFRAGNGPLSDAALQRWLTSSVPAAVLADEPLPPRPALPARSRWWGFVGRGG